MTYGAIPAPGARRPALRVAPFRRADYVLTVAVVLIAAFGILMVYTSTKVSLQANGISPDYYAKKQAEFVVIGLVLMVAASWIDFRRWRNVAMILYGISLLLLLAVFKLGVRVKGSQAWFSVGGLQFEPSETAKIALILALAAYLANRRGRLSGKDLVVGLAMAAVPIALIYKQPDLGSALVLAAVVLTMLILGGAKASHIGLLLLLAVLGTFGMVQLGVLHQYQEARLTGFIHTPNKLSLALNAGTYEAEAERNVVESKLAISAGGLTGSGIGKGVATNLSEVPEQHTDFIFSAVGEQVGLIGSLALLMLFLVVVWRTWAAARDCDDDFGKLLCIGFMAMLMFQIFENCGMAMGIMPVTGIPLPWMSYGGSAILVDFVGIGIVQSVRMRRFS